MIADLLSAAWVLASAGLVAAVAVGIADEALSHVDHWCDEEQS